MLTLSALALDGDAARVASPVSPLRTLAAPPLLPVPSIPVAAVKPITPVPAPTAASIIMRAASSVVTGSPAIPAPLRVAAAVASSLPTSTTPRALVPTLATAASAAAPPGVALDLVSGPPPYQTYILDQGKRYAITSWDALKRDFGIDGAKVWPGQFRYVADLAKYPEGTWSDLVARRSPKPPATTLPNTVSPAVLRASDPKPASSTLAPVKLAPNAATQPAPGTVKTVSTGTAAQRASAKTDGQKTLLYAAGAALVAWLLFS